MIIRRNVYFSAIDEQTGEERLYSTTELIDEESYLNEMMYSEEDEEKEFSEKKEKKMRLGDKIHIGAHKHLSYGKYRKAQIDSLEDDKATAKKGRHALAKEDAKMAALGAGIGGGIVTAAAKGNRKAAAGLTAAATVGGAAGAYVSSRVGNKIARGIRNVSSTADANSRRSKDQIKVADGQMSKEEFTKKYGKEK